MIRADNLRRPGRKVGFSLLEIIAALMIAAAIGVIGIQALRPAGTTSQQRSCDLTRQLLQDDVQRYEAFHGQRPSGNLRELQTREYSGIVLPTCPVTGQSYQLDPRGNVVCPDHEATRQPPL